MGEARLWYETLGTVQLDWQAYETASTNSIQNLVVQGSNTSMGGDHSNLVKMLTPLIHIYTRSNKWPLYYIMENHRF